MRTPDAGQQLSVDFADQPDRDGEVLEPPQGEIGAREQALQLPGKAYRRGGRQRSRDERAVTAGLPQIAAGPIGDSSLRRGYSSFVQYNGPDPSIL